MPKRKSTPGTQTLRKAAQQGKSLLSTPTDTEVEACKFILDQLKEMGWNTKNPSRLGDGQVWTQNQCLAHPEIKKCLQACRPENVIKLTEKKLWIVEAKRDRKELKAALAEAERDYARPLMA